jgi:hypothetical protein
MPPPNLKSDPVDGTFLSVLQTHKKGVCMSDLAASLTELVAHVRRTSRSGTLTLKLKISPNSKGSVEILKVEDEITLKLPKPDSGASIFYADKENRLVRNDPQQMEHPALVELPEEPAAVIKQVSSS